MDDQRDQGGANGADFQDAQATAPDSDHDTTHGACGKTWRQRGNRTGHCSGCHETFEGEALFDAHRRTAEDGTRICLEPGAMEFRGEGLRLENGTWRGPKMSAAARNAYRKEAS